jgi:hypothetical protein
MSWLNHIKNVGIGVAVVATVPILIGFGTAGIGAGTVATGSLFATAISWGMSGYSVYASRSAK